MFWGMVLLVLLAQDPLSDAVTEYERGNLCGARSKLEEILKEAPDAAIPLAYHGIVLTDLGLYELAGASLRRSAMLAPGLALAHEGLAVWHLRQGHVAEAETSFTSALDRKPANRPKLLVDRGHCSERKKKPGTISPPRTRRIPAWSS